MPAHLTPNDLFYIRRALDTIDAEADGPPDTASRRAVRMREAVASIRVLLDRADARQTVH